MRRLILLSLALAGLQVHAECYMDDSYQFRCGGNGKPYEGVAYSVFTADNPAEVLLEIDRRWPAETPWRRMAETEPTVMHVKMPTGENYPDVMCLDFKAGSRICFNPMEITER